MILFAVDIALVTIGGYGLVKMTARPGPELSGDWLGIDARIVDWGFEQAGDGPGPLPVIEPGYWLEYEYTSANERRSRRERVPADRLVTTPRGKRSAKDVDSGDRVTCWVDRTSPTSQPTLIPGGYIPAERIVMMVLVGSGILFGALGWSQL
jgi:hypothetical protein